MGKSGGKIEISNLSKIFGKRPNTVLQQVKLGKSKQDILSETGHTVGLRDINFTINPGEIFVIMGLSGSGKSTLIRHFNRLIDPTEGQIKVDNQDIMTLSKDQLIQFRRHKMSMVFQHFGLLPHRTVVDNVAYGLQIQKIPLAERTKQAETWLETVGLAGYEKQYPSQLSGGQQQRVGLARALCTDPDILLMDEAFSALDPLIRSEMQEQLLELQKTLHKTIVFITHDLDEALRIGDRIAILKDGVISQIGTPVDILLNPADDYVEAFVKDVNRARAVPVKTIMQQSVPVVSTDSLTDAFAALPPQGYLFYEREETGFQGILTRNKLEAALKVRPDGKIITEDITKIPNLMPEMLLQEAISDALKSRYALPVLNEDGRYIGDLSPESLADTLEYNN
ncbi:glycine betaine/L-proline ABC transporter ATP-binding protein [Marinomonas agarivorans]|nr:glycine betaine/L-proline ABC transporter ATP-binding protein [Marinomonas agarivorans]